MTRRNHKINLYSVRLGLRRTWRQDGADTDTRCKSCVIGRIQPLRQVTSEEGGAPRSTHAAVIESYGRIARVRRQRVRCAHSRATPAAESFYARKCCSLTSSGTRHKSRRPSRNACSMNSSCTPCMAWRRHTWRRGAAPIPRFPQRTKGRRERRYGHASLLHLLHKANPRSMSGPIFIRRGLKGGQERAMPSTEIWFNSLSVMRCLRFEAVRHSWSCGGAVPWSWHSTNSANSLFRSASLMRATFVNGVSDVVSTFQITSMRG